MINFRFKIIIKLSVCPTPIPDSALGRAVSERFRRRKSEDNLFSVCRYKSGIKPRCRKLFRPFSTLEQSLGEFGMGRPKHLTANDETLHFWYSKKATGEDGPRMRNEISCGQAVSIQHETMLGWMLMKFKWEMLPFVIQWAFDALPT